MLSKKNSTSSNGIFAVLKQRNYLIFSFSVVFTQLAFNMMNVVLIFAVYSITTSTLAVSVLLLTFLLPQIFFSFLGGIIADAKNKRKILIIGNIIRAVSVLGLFFFHGNLGIIYLLALIIAITTQFYVPAETPMIPYLVKEKYLLAANAMFGVCLFGSILIGYVLAGPLLNILGDYGIFLFIASLFAIACVCVALMPNVTPSIRKFRTEPTLLKNIAHLYKLVWEEFDQCIALIKDKPHVAVSLLFLALPQVITYLLATLVPDFATTTLHIKTQNISLFLFAPAAFGTIFAAVVIGSLFTKVSKDKIMNFGIFLSAFALFALAVIDRQHVISLLPCTIFVAFLAGISNSLIFVPSQTVVLTEVKDEFRSKIFGLLFAVVGVMALVPILLAGVFADAVGTKTVLVTIASLLSVLGVVKLLLPVAFKRGSKQV